MVVSLTVTQVMVLSYLPDGATLVPMLLPLFKFMAKFGLRRLVSLEI